MDERRREAVREFLAALTSVPWFARAGEPSDVYCVVPDVVAGWDGWNDRMLAVWEPAISQLEADARVAIGDPDLDELFRVVAWDGWRPVLAGLDAYYERRPVTRETESGADVGLRHELVDTVLRDVAWCGVERLLGRSGFFSRVMDVYREGRWPCAWEGAFPAGRFVVL